MPEPYKDPVARLLRLGRPESTNPRYYQNRGISRADIPELIRLLQDEELHYLPWDEAGHEPVEVYAAVHAWRALGELKAVEAVPALIGLLNQIDENDDDWIESEIPEVLAELGEPAFEPCRLFLLDKHNRDYARLAAAQALMEIQERQPDQRNRCLNALVEALEDYKENSDTVNGFLISYLENLKAVEADPLVRRVFEDDRADLSIMGDYEDFQVEVGLLEKRVTEPPDFFGGLLPDAGKSEPSSEGRLRQQKNEKKEKNKRKQAKRARHKNKKR